MANPRFTRRHLLLTVSFSLVFVMLFLFADGLLFNDVFFSPTWMKLREEKQSPDILILGNSHSFCSFVPQIIGDSLGMDTAVLGASGQNSAGAADSFEATLEVDAPKIVVAELNPFLTDYDSMPAYHKISALNNINGMPHLWQRVKSAWHELGFESIPQGAFQLLRADLMWSRWSGHTEIEFASDGSSLLNWHASGLYDAAAAQAAARLQHENCEPEAPEARNEREFRRVMELARKHGVKVVAVKTPLIFPFQEDTNEIEGLIRIAQEYGDTLLGAHNFHLDLGDMGLAIRDFYDQGHLSRSGAAKFSIRFARWLGGQLGIEPELDNVFAYAGEGVEELPDGTWRYSMDALGKEIEYRFMLDGEILQDWSSQNSVILDLPPSEESRLSVSMRQAEMPENEMTMTFMAANTYVVR